MPIPDQAHAAFVSNLEQAGLDLCAFFDLDTLPEAITASFSDIREYRGGSLVLVASKGGAFWEYLEHSAQTWGHCLDRISRKRVADALASHVPQSRYTWLYPDSEYVIPLQQLGREVGWGRASQLGLDIHPLYGTWFAYRAALLVSEPFPASIRVSVKPVCENCTAKPCQNACPVGAVRDIGNFSLDDCMSFRMGEASPCADRCLARLACPVGKEYRYSQAQLAHHGKFSLASIQRWKNANG